MSKFIGIIILCCIYTVSTAQDAEWFVGVWSGAHTAVKGKQTQSLDISLHIESVSGSNFVGFLQLSFPADTSVHLDIRLTGDIQHDFIRATFKDVIYKKDPPGNKWETRCMTCGPGIYFFSIKDGKFFLTTETTNCYKSCNGTAVYSRDLTEFDAAVAASLDTLVNNKNIAVKKDTTSAAPPVAVVAAPETAPAAVTKINLADVMVIPEKRNYINDPKKIVVKNTAALKPSQTVEIPAIQVPVIIQKINLADVMVIPGKKDIIPAIKNKTAKNAAMLKPSMTVVVLLRRGPEKPAPIVVVPKKDTVVTAKNIVAKKDTVKVKPPVAIVKVPKKDTVKPAVVAVVPKKDKEVNKDTVKIKPPVAIVKVPAKDSVKPVANAVVVPKTDTVAAVKIKPAEVIAAPAKKDTIVNPKPAQYEKRSANLVQTYVVNTDSVELKLYDNGVVDGDTISVFNNGQLIVSMLGLTSSAHEIKIAVDKTNDNQIVFYAHNLGLFPPNTTLLYIYSGKTKYTINISSDLHISSGIIIHYVKP